MKCDSLEEVLKFFSESGIATRADSEGRIYPYSEEASAVSETLIKRAVRLGTVLLTDSEVRDVEASPAGGFRIFVCNDDKTDLPARPAGNAKAGSAGKAGVRSAHGADCVRAARVLIATGGKSFAVYGSTGDGYSFARKLGHAVTPLIPSLTAIEVSDDIKSLKGVRVKGEVSLYESGNLSFRESGEVQFKDDSVSGICMMNMSAVLPRSAGADRASAFENARISINLVPDFDARGLMDFLRAEQYTEGNTAFDLVETLVKKPLAYRILENINVDPKMPASELGSPKLLDLANALRSFDLVPCGRKGWKEAQVTGGGVELAEVDEASMESKLVPGLYFAGEVLDYDGPCGGYNLHNAWLTGIKAGRAMGRQR